MKEYRSNKIWLPSYLCEQKCQEAFGVHADHAQDSEFERSRLEHIGKQDRGEKTVLLQPRSRAMNAEEESRAGRE